MLNFNYKDIIEYIDDTFDENFEAARAWCKEHSTTLEELIDRKIEKEGVLYRYFQIGEAPKPYTPSKEDLIRELKNKLAQRDYVIIKIAEGVSTKEEYADVIAQRQRWREEINELENSID